MPESTASAASIRVPCQRQELGSVRHFVEQYLAGVPVSPKLAAQLLVAVDEVCANVIIHGNRENPSCHLTVRARRETGAVVFELLDRGTPFQSQPPPSPDLHAYIRQGRKGGLGLTLVHLIMDRVDFATAPDGQNLTRLVKAI